MSICDFSLIIPNIFIKQLILFILLQKIYYFDKLIKPYRIFCSGQDFQFTSFFFYHIKKGLFLSIIFSFEYICLTFNSFRLSFVFFWWRYNFVTLNRCRLYWYLHERDKFRIYFSKVFFVLLKQCKKQTFLENKDKSSKELLKIKVLKRFYLINWFSIKHLLHISTNKFPYVNEFFAFNI